MTWSTHEGAHMTHTVIQTFHPLDPPNADGFRQAASILRREHGVGDRWRCASIQLAEPSNEEIAACDASGTTPDRRAIAHAAHRSGA